MNPASLIVRFALAVAMACADAGVSCLRAPMDMPALDLPVDFSLVTGAVGRAYRALTAPERV